jgi:hypothetical protein
MSYTIGTDLGRLREILGDADSSSELFSDAYLNDLLSTRNTVAQAAVAALRRVMLDPQLIREKFKGYGQINANVLPNLIRVLEELIAHILDGSEDMSTATGSDSALPEADNDASGFSTDENSSYRTGYLGTYLNELKARK